MPAEFGHGEWDQPIGIRIALDKAAYVYGVGNSVIVYGAGFRRHEHVLPQLQGAVLRGFRTKRAYADANGSFSTTISLLLGSNKVEPGVYTIRLAGGKGSVATIPVVVVSER